MTVSESFPILRLTRIDPQYSLSPLVSLIFLFRLTLHPRALHDGTHNGVGIVPGTRGAARKAKREYLSRVVLFLFGEDRFCAKFPRD